MPAASPVQDRFWSKVDKTETCWLWMASVDNRGYPQLHKDGGTVRAHRYAYELLVGSIPSGLDLDHLCRVRRCVNPTHLEPVTRKENSRRGMSPNMQAHRANRCRRGHPFTEANTIRKSNGTRQCRTCRLALRRENGN